jgi:hypothetical protein
MLKSFSQFFNESEYDLHEKLIIYNNDKRYGQIVFLAGGAGSGKGFAIKNFMHNELFKIRDIDELKTAFQKLDQLQKFSTDELLSKYGSKLSPEVYALVKKILLDDNVSLKNLDLRTPEHVFLLHMLVKATGAKEKTLDLMLANAREGLLPNIMFDMTLKDTSELDQYLPKLVEIGYDPKNIHITWVLTNYEVAIKNNASRDRVVPADILLQTHEGAARTVLDLVKGGLPKEVNGSFYVILNNRENTTYFTDKSGKEIKNSRFGEKTVKDFMYLTLKKSGKPVMNDANVKKQLYSWVMNNVPSSVLKNVNLQDL